MIWGSSFSQWFTNSPLWCPRGSTCCLSPLVSERCRWQSILHNGSCPSCQLIPVQEVDSVLGSCSTAKILGCCRSKAAVDQRQGSSQLSNQLLCMETWKPRSLLNSSRSYGGGIGGGCEVTVDPVWWEPWDGRKQEPSSSNCWSASQVCDGERILFGALFHAAFLVTMWHPDLWAQKRSAPG